MFCLMLGSWLHSMLSKYWILVCAVLFLVLAIQQPNVYRIIYMVLFLYFVISFQVWIFLLLCKMTNFCTLLMYMHFCHMLISYSYGKTDGYWLNEIQTDPYILHIFHKNEVHSIWTQLYLVFSSWGGHRVCWNYWVAIQLILLGSC